MTNVGYIYKHINSINGKAYIGQTVNPRTRFCPSNYNKQQVIWGAISKHGWDNFSTEILETIEADSRETLQELLNDAEIRYIAKHNTTLPNGYNATTGGGQHYYFTEEIRAKLRGKRPHVIPWNFGKTPSEETIMKALFTKAVNGTHNKGHGKSKLTKEWRKNLSISHIGNEPSNKGIPMKPEAIAKMSKAKIGNIPVNKGTKSDRLTRLRVSFGTILTNLKVKRIRCLETGREYTSLRELSKDTGLKEGVLKIYWRKLKDKDSGTFQYNKHTIYKIPFEELIIPEAHINKLKDILKEIKEIVTKTKEE